MKFIKLLAFTTIVSVNNLKPFSCCFKKPKKIQISNPEPFNDHSREIIKKYMQRAAFRDFILDLIKNDKDLNSTYKYKTIDDKCYITFPLVFAVNYADEESVKLLLENKACPNIYYLEDKVVNYDHENNRYIKKSQSILEYMNSKLLSKAMYIYHPLRINIIKLLIQSGARFYETVYVWPWAKEKIYDKYKLENVKLLKPINEAIREAREQALNIDLDVFLKQKIEDEVIEV